MHDADHQLERIPVHPVGAAYNIRQPLSPLPPQGSPALPHSFIATGSVPMQRSTRLVSAPSVAAGLDRSVTGRR
jgi:hypothetical protein